MCYCCCADNNIHYLEDGNFFIEVEGLPEISYDDDERAVEVKKPSRIRFDKSPIKVRLC